VEIPVTLFPRLRSCHVRDGSFCGSSFQPNLTRGIVDEPLHHSLGGFPHRSHGTGGFDLVLLSSSHGHVAHSGQQCCHLGFAAGCGLGCVIAFCVFFSLNAYACRDHSFLSSPLPDGSSQKGEGYAHSFHLCLPCSRFRWGLLERQGSIPEGSRAHVH